MKPRDLSVIATETDYGGPFCSMIWRGKLFATQFHPEKSQSDGLRILRNFAELAGRGRTLTAATQRGGRETAMNADRRRYIAPTVSSLDPAITISICVYLRAFAVPVAALDNSPRRRRSHFGHLHRLHSCGIFGGFSRYDSP